jgi:hypothetical protein
VGAWSVAVGEAAALPRDVVRATAVARWDLRRMVDEYEQLYRSLSHEGAAA